jgi:hypothetical protein
VESAKSLIFDSLLAEIVLQLIGSPYLGMTVDFARKKGYYQANKLKGMPHGWDALVSEHLYFVAWGKICKASFRHS